MRNALRLILILAVCAGMITLCVLWFNLGGMWGLVGGGIGFLWGVGGGGQSSMGERMGNGYVGALMGLSVGMAAGAFTLLLWPQLWAYAQAQMH
jgi:hypothetical protein